MLMILNFGFWKKLTPNYFNRIDIQRKLFHEEAFWTYKLQTLAPNELNINLELYSFLNKTALMEF